MSKLEAYSVDARSFLLSFLLAKIRKIFRFNTQLKCGQAKGNLSIPLCSLITATENILLTSHFYKLNCRLSILRNYVKAQFLYAESNNKGVFFSRPCFERHFEAVTNVAKRQLLTKQLNI